MDAGQWGLEATPVVPEARLWNEEAPEPPAPAFVGWGIPIVE